MKYRSKQSILTIRSVLQNTLAGYLLLIINFAYSNSSNSKELLLDDGDVCKNTKLVTFELGSKDESVIIISQLKYFEPWTGRYSFSCKFRVRALKDLRSNSQGIYVVVQDLNLRRNSTTNECIDFIEVEEKRSWSILPKRQRLAKFCGHLGVFSFDESDNLSKTVAPNSFVAPSGEVAVEIFVAQQKLQFGEKIEMKIVFTAFNPDCPVYKRDSLAHCARGECIWDGLFEDGIQNCPYLDCLDRDCQDSAQGRRKRSSGMGPVVTIITIAGILLIFSLFCICLCICKRSQLFCWANRNSRQGQSRAPTPSAPPEFIIASTPSKDAPPTYESLFPPTISDNNL